MPRVTNAQVQAIYPRPNDDLTTFIVAADIIVSEDLANSGLSSDRLDQIEIYLAAHFAVITLERGGLTRRKIGESEDYYQIYSNKEIGFLATRFGQQATILDTTGTLADIGSPKPKALFKLVSTSCN